MTLWYLNRAEPSIGGPSHGSVLHKGKWGIQECAEKIGLQKISLICWACMIQDLWLVLQFPLFRGASLPSMQPQNLQCVLVCKCKTKTCESMIPTELKERQSGEALMITATCAWSSPPGGNHPVRGNWQSQEMWSSASSAKGPLVKCQMFSSTFLLAGVSSCSH